MAEYSPRLNLPFIQQAQAQKHVTHNEAIERLDLLVQLVVEGFGATTPPVDPQEGQIWALGATPTAAWAGQGNMLAAFAGGGWLFLAPREGWLATSAGTLLLWNGTAWVMPELADVQNLPGMGINTSHDSTNRLAVSAPATLLTHEGADHRLTINKSAEGDTASLLFQTGWSGRAEMGTTGQDNFAVKVSADGVNWHTGLMLDRNTGNAVMNQLEATALSGMAVTQSATDTASGRLLRVGSGHFLGVPNAATDLPGGAGVNNADLAPAAIHFYPTTTSTINGPGHAGTALRFQRGSTGFADLWLRADAPGASGMRLRSGALGGAVSEWLTVFHTANSAQISATAAVISNVGDTGAVSTVHTRAVIASQSCKATGAESLVAASRDNCETSGAQSAVIASRDSRAAGEKSAVIGSRAVVNNVADSLAMGRAASGGALAANRTIHLFSDGGNIRIAGSLTSSHTFSDFAEMFPNATGAEIPLGTIVTEEGGAVRPAGPGDDIAGVVTATAIVTAGDTPFAWQGRYMSDEWGQPITEQIPDPDWAAEVPDPDWAPQTDENGEPVPDQEHPLIPNVSPQSLIRVQKESPDWNPSAPQIPRSERPEQWTRVGLLGQVFTRVAEDVVGGDRLTALGGVGVRASEHTGLRCMTITQPYDAEKGYAIARCLINIRV